MDSWKGPKRLLEFQPCASGKQKASQIETGGAEAKRQRRASNSTGDDFEEFVALFEKIQYMKTNHRNFGIWDELSMRQDSDMKVMKSKSPWIPSFEWEDFSAKDNIKRISADHFNTAYSSYDKRPAESFDLNVEASSNQEMSAGF